MRLPRVGRNEELLVEQPSLRLPGAFLRVALHGLGGRSLAVASAVIGDRV